MNANRGDNAVFPDQATDLVDLGRALSNQLLSNAMHGLDILLFNRLGGDKAHIRTAHGFTDGFSINSIILVAFDVGFNKLGGNQANPVAALLQFTRPVMSRSTGLHADFSAVRYFLANRIQPFITRVFTLPTSFTLTICAMDMKDRLCNINIDTDNGHLDFSSLLDGL